MDAKILCQKITGNRATTQEKDALMMFAHDKLIITDIHYRRYCEGDDSDWLLRLAVLSVSIHMILNPQNYNTMKGEYPKERSEQLRKGQWVSLETVRENLRRSGMKPEALLEISSNMVRRRIYEMFKQLPDEDLMTLYEELSHNKIVLGQNEPLKS